MRTLAIFHVLLTATIPLTHASSYTAVIEILSASPFPLPSFRARCTSLPPNVCCRPINLATSSPSLATTFAGDFAIFQNLPQDAVSTVHTWNGSPSLPANLNAACGQQVLDISGKKNWSWRASAVENSNADSNRAGVTSKIITGAKYFLCPLGKNTNLGSSSMGAFRNTWAEIVKMCIGGVFSISRIPPARKRRRVRSEEEEAWAYPDVILYNGTEYSDGHRGDRVYKDDGGHVLDLELLNG